VTRTGSKLSATFVGFNAFGSVSGCEGTPWTDTQMNAYFGQLAAGNLTRVWCFPGTNLADVDRLVAAAKAHHQYVVLVLENDLGDCTNSAKTLSWYSTGYRTSFLAWCTTVALRYANSTAVAFYEVINEAGMNQGADNVLTGTTMKAFYQAAASTIKAADPNHLVGTGDAAEYLYIGNQAGYQTAASAAAIDILSLHDYESDWIDNAPAVSTHWTPCKQAADALAKPIIVGEINDGLSHFSSARARASSVTSSAQQYLAAGAGAVLVWNYTYTDGSYDADYSIVPTDPMVGAVAGMTALRK
jgi:endo-1,4-beta-mannosidase